MQFHLGFPPLSPITRLFCQASPLQFWQGQAEVFAKLVDIYQSKLSCKLKSSIVNQGRLKTSNLSVMSLLLRYLFVTSFVVGAECFTRSCVHRSSFQRGLVSQAPLFWQARPLYFGLHLVTTMYGAQCGAHVSAHNDTHIYTHMYGAQCGVCQVAHTHMCTTLCTIHGGGKVHNVVCVKWHTHTCLFIHMFVCSYTCLFIHMFVHTHWLPSFDFSPLCVSKCLLKLQQSKSSFAACSEEGAGICSTLLVVFSCILIVVAFMFLAALAAL